MICDEICIRIKAKVKDEARSIGGWLNPLKLIARPRHKPVVTARSYNKASVGIKYFCKVENGWLTSDGRLFMTADFRTFIVREMQ